MNSPLVRRKRLAGEVRALREAKGLTHEQLGELSGFHRLKISRLETGERPPNVAHVERILAALKVEGDLLRELLHIAEQASERGWWARSRDIGPRQRIYADLEAGAASIREYQIFVIPGLLQIPAYVRRRGLDSHTGNRPQRYLERNIEARARRQEQCHRPDGPEYEVIIDEPAIRRLSAPPDIMRAQLRHLAEVAGNSPRTSVRVLPVDAQIPGYEVSRSPFSLFGYPDPGDPAVAAVDTETVDLIFTEREEVDPYQRRFDRLRTAALTGPESIELIERTADGLDAPS